MTKNISPEMRRQSGRMAVVLLSMIIITLPFGFIVMFLSIIPILRLISKHPTGLDILLVLIVLFPALSIGMVIGSVVWIFLMSFYLTIDEWKEINETKGPEIPVITPIFERAEAIALRWKLARERKHDDNQD
jgi:hypothetical protein